MQNIWIPNILFIFCQSSNTLTFSNNCIAFPSAQGLKVCISSQAYHLWPSLYSSSRARQEHARIKEVKHEKMYGGGSCGYMTEPLLVWMKVEHCTLFVGCTSTFLEVDDYFTNTHGKDDNSYDKCYFGGGKLQYTKYLDSELFFIPCQTTNSPSSIQTRNRWKQ